MKTPYIGITGFMSRREVQAAWDSLPKPADRIDDLDRPGFTGPKRLLMVGVLVSGKTLRGKPNSWPGRFPPVHTIHTIFHGDPDHLNMVHYSTDQPEQLFDDLMAIDTIVGDHLCGFQLNIAWPPSDQIRRYRKTPNGKNKRIILQISPRSLDTVDNDPARLAQKLSNEYESWGDGVDDCVDDVLFDMSRGRGQTLDPAMMRRHIEMFKLANLQFGIVLGGGLCADTLHIIEPLVRDNPTLSIDAEGKLRTPQPEDKMNMEAVRDYLKAAAELFGRNEGGGI